jgi:hypothetical protein
VRSTARIDIYIGILLILGIAMAVIGSLVTASVGGLAILVLGAAGVAAALTLVGIRMLGRDG